MNSGTHLDVNIEKQETSAINKFQAVEFILTLDQYTIIQHFLPKGYTLQQRKFTKRIKGSSNKLIDAEMSRFSGIFENTQEMQGRSKRARIKKIDRYLEEQIPRVFKKNSQKLSLDQEINNCIKILQLLKKHPNAIPFLEPVDPKKSGASHYFDVIKDPMDLSTIEKNLKLGEYQTSTQFHADISKIWYNSYAYNQKSSKIYKVTVEMQKYYKKISEESIRKMIQHKNKSKNPPQKIKISYEYNENNMIQDIIHHEQQKYEQDDKDGQDNLENNQFEA